MVLICTVCLGMVESIGYNLILNIFIDFSIYHTFILLHIHPSPFVEVPLCFFIVCPAQLKETSMWVPGRESNLG
jgi:hypothetical protein